VRYDINFDIEFRQISRVPKPFIGSGGQSSSSHCRNDTDLFKNHRKEKFAVKKVSMIESTLTLSTTKII
jgi:hypothetical protein